MTTHNETTFTTPGETTPNRGRIYRAMVRMAAALDSFRAVPDEDVATLDAVGRDGWNNAMSAIVYRIDACANVLSATVPDEDVEDASDNVATLCEDRADESERWALHHGAILAAALDAARSSIAIGHAPSTDDRAAAIGRGLVFLNHARRYSVETAHHAFPAVTLWDVLVAAQDVEDRAAADVRGVSRTLRAADDRHTYEQFEPIMSQMVRDGSLTHHAWRTTHLSMQRLALRGDGSCAVVGPRIPTNPREMGHGATVDDLLRAVEDVRRVATADMVTLGARLLDEATDGVGRSWCPEYESTMRRLNESLRLVEGAPFRGRTHRYDVSGSVDVTLTITVPLSGTIDARDSDEAWTTDALDVGEVTRWDIAEALGVSADVIARMTWDVDHDTLQVDGVDESDED